MEDYHTTHNIYTVNDSKYLVRILKEPLLIRQNEVIVHSAAADKFIAPKIYHHQHTKEFSLIIMDFIPESTLSLEQAKDYYTIDFIARKVKSIQELDLNFTLRTRNLFTVIIENYEKIKNKNLIIDPIFEEILDKVKIIYQKFENNARPLVISHNDLHPRNIFFTGTDVIIIDWEMVGFNDQFYDLAVYSLCACLNEKDDFYLLKQYLQKDPCSDDMQHFNIVKLLARVTYVFSTFEFLNHIPEVLSVESFNNFEYYENIFAQDSTANSSELLLALGVSQLQLFLEEYKSFKI